MKSDDLKFILGQIAEGNQKAFRYLFTSYSGKVYTYALKLTHTKEQAEEIVQEVFMKIWINRDTLTSIDFFPSYLYTITRNHTFNFLKHLSVERKARMYLHEESFHLQVATSSYQHQIEHAIKRLPPQQQVVYKMCYHEGMKYEEVAERLSISRFTVKTHMQQALRSIRVFLQTPSI